MKQYWFKRKRYGLGWIPVTWQGWSVLGIYLVAVLAAAYNANMLTLKSTITLFSFLPEVIFYTIILLLICAKTGEPLRWQWGEKSKEVQ